MKQKQVYFVRKLLLSLLTLFLIITVNFVLIRIMPGDPLINIIGDSEYQQMKSRNPEALEELRSLYKLDGTIAEQYMIYLRKIAVLDFGFSYIRNQSVLEIVLFRLRWTLILAIPAFVFSAVAGGYLGMKGGWNLGGRFDSMFTPIAVVLNTVPANCLAIICLSIFASKLGIFPLSGMTRGGLTGFAKFVDVIWHMALPFSILSIFRIASNYIQMRSFVIGVKKEDYILTAKSKGLNDDKILKRHALRNCFLPYITVLCMQFGHILAGSMMVEIVFSWQGMGTLINSSIISKDYNTFQLCFLMIAICTLFANNLADFLYVVFDPRVEEETA